MSRVDHDGQLLFRCARLGVKHRRGGTNGLHADFQLDVQLFGVLPDLPEIVGIQAANETDFGEMDHLDLLGSAVIEVFKRSPLLRRAG